MEQELLTRLESTISQIDDYIASNELDNAIKLLFETIREYPQYGKAYNYLGWIYDAKQRRYNEAEILYKKCIELMPEYPAAYFNYLYLLNLFQRGEDAKQLINILNRMININRYRLLKEWAFMLEYTGCLDEAMSKQKEAFLAAVSNVEIEEAQKDMARINRKIIFLKNEIQNEL